MSYFGFRFDKVRGDESEELKNLYRVRDNDPYWAEYHRKFTYNKENYLDRRQSFTWLTKNFNIVNDPVYDNMTDGERFENGRPSRLVNFVSSKGGVILLAFLLNVGFYQYSRIHWPAGVILRAQRPESMFTYFQ